MDFVVSANSSTSALGSQPLPTEGVVPVVVEPPKATPVTPSEPVVAEAAAPEGPRVPADVSATTPAITAHTLVFDFDDVSWLEVKDASQRIVLTGEFPKGTRQVVNGRPPFQLWIGKAAGVRLVYGERKVDLQPYTRDAVARLTLD
jgi:cytoskeleton protein RodZ